MLSTDRDFELSFVHTLTYNNYVIKPLHSGAPQPSYLPNSDMSSTSIFFRETYRFNSIILSLFFPHVETSSIVCPIDEHIPLFSVVSYLNH